MRSVSELEGHEVMQRGMHNTAYLLDEFKIDPALAVRWFGMKAMLELFCSSGGQHLFFELFCSVVRLLRELLGARG